MTIKDSDFSMTYPAVQAAHRFAIEELVKIVYRRAAELAEKSGLEPESSGKLLVQEDHIELAVADIKQQLAERETA